MLFRLEITENDDPFRVRLWNTFDLDEVHHKLPNGIFKTADGIIMGFDIASRESFNACKEYMERIQLYSSDQISILIIGTLEGSDEERREISLGEATEFAYSHGAKKYLEYRFGKDDLLTHEVNRGLQEIFRVKNLRAIELERQKAKDESNCNIF